MNSDLDDGIEKNLDGSLIQKNMHDDVKYEVESNLEDFTFTKLPTVIFFGISKRL